LPPNPRWGMSEQGSKMTGMDAAPLEHMDVRIKGLQGCAGIATLPEGHCFERSRGASGGTHTDVCAAWPGMVMPGAYEVGRTEQFVRAGRFCRCGRVAGYAS
jgi:hypothetical protein